jgi:hypothetical protein
MNGVERVGMLIEGGPAASIRAWQGQRAWPPALTGSKATSYPCSLVCHALAQRVLHMTLGLLGQGMIATIFYNCNTLLGVFDSLRLHIVVDGNWHTDE